MRLPSFGRKASSPPPPPPSQPSPGRGHRAVLDRLNELDATKPEARLQLAGAIVFDLLCQMLKTERGVRIEDMLAILGSVGGHACLLGAMHGIVHGSGKTGGMALVTMTAVDGHKYYFGDAPNALLLESHLSLLSLTLGMAQHLGAKVSLEKVHDVMRHVAGSGGSAEFGIPRIADPHAPGDLPFNYIRHLAPKIFEALDLYEVPMEKRATALGFAIQKALQAAPPGFDLALAVDIVTECAVPAAKFDPMRFR